MAGHKGKASCHCHSLLCQHRCPMTGAMKADEFENKAADEFSVPAKLSSSFVHLQLYPSHVRSQNLQCQWHPLGKAYPLKLLDSSLHFLYFLGRLHSSCSFWAFLFCLFHPMLWPLHTCVLRFCARPIFPVSVRILTRSNIGPGGRKTVVEK